MKERWAIIGLGFVAQRHMDAIEDVGDELIMACDNDIRKFDKITGNVFRCIDWITMISVPEFRLVDNVAICTPNHLHPPMIVECEKRGKKVLCEKPLTIDSKYLNLMNGTRTVLQLRHNPELIELKKQIASKHEVMLKLLINRGDFYWDGWKGNSKKSGGLLFNIGIHYFDLLQWLFGDLISSGLTLNEINHSIGRIEFEKGTVHWEISLKQPMDAQVRTLEIDNKQYNLAKRFENLHLKVYEDFKNGKGVNRYEAGKSIKLVERILGAGCTTS
ncbi:hypothetical protein CMI37_32215 [Candidatus Pacearchaeota archaeon]|nr:hypothetical protein [Candidatus Pacearchaeota archaeon]|tara:strand:+ start:6800 stop:7621 length:822 start_codon:yes stop_codon:yes gene_type:complete